MANKKRVFIAFEGLDGSGSSTQVEILKKNLNNLGLQTISTKEPTNNIVGGLIRGVLTREWQTTPEGLQLLFAADRAHHLKNKILPNLKKGKIVITDRYYFSSIAFGSLDLDKKWLLMLNYKFPVPDITFLLKVPPLECIRRVANIRGSFELFEEEKKLKKVWRAYSWLSQNKKYHIQIIDGEKSIDDISNQILEITQKKFFSIRQTKELASVQ